MKLEWSQIQKAVLAKDVRTLGKLVSAAEDRDSELLPILSKLFGEPRHASVLGFTGPPGAGKSTLIARMVAHLRKSEKRVAVVAVDPVSPYSGGALLGDRIRLADHFNDPEVFIRSLSTRGRLGGLSSASREVLLLLDAFRYDWILVETVGVGQSEVDVRTLADAVLLVLVPESGDSIQTSKAGVLEIGDIFTVHKSDRPGSEEVRNELNVMLELSGKTGTPVCMTTQSDPTTLTKLFETVESYFHLQKAKIDSRRKLAEQATLYDLVQGHLAAEVNVWAMSVAAQGGNPYDAFLAFLGTHPKGSLFRL